MNTRTCRYYPHVFVYITIILSFMNQAYTQWQPDVRLTNNSAVSQTSFNNAKSISALANYLHVLWLDTRDGNNEIYYKRSTDGGLSWGADTRLTNDTAVSTGPCILASGQVVHAVWQDMRHGNFEIFYKRSTNAGTSWGADTRLTNNSAVSWMPSISAVTITSSVIHLVWRDYRDGNDEIYYKRSTDGGVSWGNDTRLTINTYNSISPTVTASGSIVNTAWYDTRDGNNEIYCKRSTDAGVTWGNDIRLTNNSSPSFWPNIASSGANVYIAWWDSRDGNPEIYFKRSTDDGVNWSADLRLTNNSSNSTYPSVSVSGQTVIVVWADDRDGNYEIYCKRSTNGGVSWEPDTRLTINSAQSDNPSNAVLGQAVHVVWREQRDGNEEIYYKLNPTGAFVGVTKINSQIPEYFSLSQNYPNPFNPTTHFEFRISDFGFIKLEVFNTLGQLQETLVNEELRPGVYEAEWNASKLSSGVYYYRLTADGFTETKRMVLVK